MHHQGDLLNRALTRAIRSSDLVQQGISEKVALVFHFIATFVSGFVIAYARSWRLALALSSMLPCIAIAGGVMAKFIATYTQYVFLSTIRACVAKLILAQAFSQACGRRWQYR